MTKLSLASNHIIKHAKNPKCVISKEVEKSPMFCGENTDKTNSSLMLMQSPQGIVEGEKLFTNTTNVRLLLIGFLESHFANAAKSLLSVPLVLHFMGAGG